jgi:hypothetical protein
MLTSFAFQGSRKSRTVLAASSDELIAKMRDDR